MGHLIKSLFIATCLLAVTACDTSWDSDYEDDRDTRPVAYEANTPSPVYYDTQYQGTYQMQTQTAAKKQPLPDEPLPLQGPCAPWEAGCFVDLKTPPPSFNVAEGPCMMRYGPYGILQMTGRCQKKPAEKEPEKPIRSHCFRNDNWETCY